MAGVVFSDGGHTWYSEREKFLSLDGHLFQAITRQTLPSATDASKEVLVLSGPKIIGKLPPQVARAVRTFSESIRYYTDRAGLSAIAAWKNRVAMRDRRAALSLRNTSVVAWDFGPVEVLQIGTYGAIPVCVTPSKTSQNQKGLFSDAHHDDCIVLDLLNDHLINCLDEYMCDVADLLRGAFLRSKEHARRISRKVERILETSVRPKLKLTQSVSEHAAVRRRQNEIQHKYATELAVYNVAVDLASIMSECLRSCVTQEDEWRTKLKAVNAAIFRLSDDILEKPRLLKCVRLLRNPPSSDEVSPLTAIDLPANRWIEPLTQACRFLSEVRHLLDGFGRYKIPVFVTHHMDVYASEAFYHSAEKYATEEFRESLVIWTGTGRQSHIQLAILAKIWISDIQVLYVPNSLDTYHGNKKTLADAGDWVIEEIAYGALISKPLHCVMAEGAEHIRGELERQLAAYKWESLQHSFAHISASSRVNHYVELGRALTSEIAQHLRQRIYSTHHPNVTHLKSEDRQHLLKGCFQAALKMRFSAILWGLRLGLQSDHWRVFQALIRIDKLNGTLQTPLAITSGDIVGELDIEEQTTGIPVTREWVRRVLWRLESACAFVGPERFPCVREGRRKDRYKTYHLALQDIIPRLSEIYGIPVAEDDIREIFWDTVEYPVGDDNAARRRLTRRAGI